MKTRECECGYCIEGDEDCLTYEEQRLIILDMQREILKYKNQIKEDNLDEIIRRNEVYQHNIMMSAKD